MNRRSFVAALACLPVVGKLVAQHPYPHLPVDPYCPGHPDEQMPTGVRWHRPGMCPLVVRDRYCPIGQAWVFPRPPGPPKIIRSIGNEPIHTFYLVRDVIARIA